MGTSCVGKTNFMHESQIKLYTTITKRMASERLGSMKVVENRVEMEN